MCVQSNLHHTKVEITSSSRHNMSLSSVCTHLSLHVHDDHRVGAVTHDKVLGVLGQQDDVVDGDVGACRRAQGFEGV